jgi:UDP-N-acetylglucosamine:LPS N-acetylglucosamine transferase
VKANHKNIKHLLPQNQTIIIAPLCWGLGHATRTIPIIKEALANRNNVIVASDGDALALIKAEFPDLNYYELQGYNVRYPFNSIFINIVFQFFKIMKAYFIEKNQIRKLAKSVNAKMIISDNRYGCRTGFTKNIFVTHQLSIHHHYRLISSFASYVNRITLSSFDQVWVPDDEDHSLAGALSATTSASLAKKVKYIGALSRVKVNHKMDFQFNAHEILILLSGPEPQRTYLEQAIYQSIKGTSHQYQIIRGSRQESEINYAGYSNIKVVDFADTNTVQQAINNATLIITRSGYTTIMDLAEYKGKVILIPTPGQTEQEYLAEHHTRKDNYYHLTQKDIESKLSSLIEECIN